MGPIHLFDVASRVNHWLTVRQSAIAQNVANVNTPGFKAQDIKPFESTLEAMSLAMASTRSGHMTHASGIEARTEFGPDEAGEVLHSGNTVSLESEMSKAGEVNRSYALNTSVLKAFHRMLMASSKG
ncbi:MAG: flagellar basal body rod protein FlgB [Hyphomicrobiaceae bacterium]|jgi:flagellar basal-body rod protein FlgB